MILCLKDDRMLCIHAASYREEDFGQGRIVKKYISHQALELSVAFKTKYAGYCSQRAVYHTQVIAKTAQQKVS